MNVLQWEYIVPFQSQTLQLLKYMSPLLIACQWHYAGAVSKWLFYSDLYKLIIGGDIFNV